MFIANIFTLNRNLSLLLGKLLEWDYFIPIRKKLLEKILKLHLKIKLHSTRIHLLKCYQHYGIVLSDFLSQKK